jgi:hypothetical protein
VTTDDDYRDASKRKPENFGAAPRVVMGARLSQPGEQPKLESYEQTPPASPEARARARARRDTLLGMGGKPAPQVTLPPPRAPYQGPRNVSPPPFASPVEVEAIKREAARTGDRVVEPPRSIPPPASVPAVDLRWDAQKGLRGGVSSPAIRRVIAWALPLILGGGAGAATSTATKPAQPVPPGVLECPAQIEALRGELRRVRTDSTRAADDADEAKLKNVRTERRLEQIITELEAVKKSTPRIEGVVAK